jgi:hypothetical protein
LTSQNTDLPEWAALMILFFPRSLWNAKGHRAIDVSSDTSQTSNKKALVVLLCLPIQLPLLLW